MPTRPHRCPTAVLLALTTLMGACGSTSGGEGDAASEAGSDVADDGDAPSDRDDGDGAGGGEASDTADADGAADVADDGGGSDGGDASGAGGRDAVVDDAPRGCDPSRPFGASVPIDSLNGQGGHEGGARLSADELTVYFFSDRLGAYDIFTATRPDRSAAFGTPQPIASLNTGAYDDFASLTADGLTVYIETNRTSNYEIFYASRSTLSAPFSEPVPVPNIDDVNAIEAFPFIRPDNSGLYFTSDRPTTIGGYNLYFAERGTDGQFGAPALLSTINSSMNEWSMVPSFDELTVYFASDRSDPLAKGVYDIFMARRSSKTAPFDPPVILPELNTPAEDVPSWISPDNCRLYLTHIVSIGRKIYMAERAP